MDERNYNRDMDAAPKDEELLLLLPTGLDEEPLALELGSWDDGLARWEGDWRRAEGEGTWPNTEPIAWAEVPGIDADILEEYGIEVVDVA